MMDGITGLNVAALRIGGHCGPWLQGLGVMPLRRD
jgi:hypothetical protein